MSIDLTSADKDAVRSLNRIRNNPDFIVYQEWLEGRLKKIRKQNDMLTGDQLKWSQGRCQAIQMILDAPDLAQKILQNAR